MEQEPETEIVSEEAQALLSASEIVVIPEEGTITRVHPANHPRRPRQRRVTFSDLVGEERAKQIGQDRQAALVLARQRTIQHLGARAFQLPRL